MMYFITTFDPLLRNNNSNSRELGIPVVPFRRGRTTEVERLISEERTPEFVSRDRINTRGLLKITEKCKKPDLRVART